MAIRNAICKAGEADLTTVFHLTYWMHALTFSLRPSCICILYFEYHEFSAMQEPAPAINFVERIGPGQPASALQDLSDARAVALARRGAVHSCSGVYIQAYILLFSSIEGLLGNSNPPDQLSEWNSRFGLRAAPQSQGTHR